MSDVVNYILTYPGTAAQVLIGDRVAKKKWLSLFGAERLGRVIYVPGQCPPHPEMERDGMAYWAVRFDNGMLAAWLHHPKVNAIRKFRLIERGDPGSGVRIGERLFEDESFDVE